MLGFITTLVMTTATSIMQPTSAMSSSPLLYRLAHASDHAAVATLRTIVFSPHLTAPYSKYQQERLYEDAIGSKDMLLAQTKTAQGVAGRRRSCAA